MTMMQTPKVRTDMERKLAIGIDIGGTNTKFGVVDTTGNILWKGEMKTTGHAQPNSYVEALRATVIPGIEKCGGIKGFCGIGVGAPNGNYYSGCIEHAANLEWKGIVPIADMISKAFQLPVQLTNDANAAAMGEMQYGAARGMKDFIVITLGTGVGSGIVSNGKLVIGHDGFAGELGHTVIRPGGRFHPGTGLKGSLEMYCSAGGMVANAQELLAIDPHSSLLRDIPESELTSAMIFECAGKGDKIANDTFKYTGQLMGEAFANFVMFSSPEAIILFGGITKAGELIRKPVVESMERHLLKVFQNKVKILFSELDEADSAILGAAALVEEFQ